MLTAKTEYGKFSYFDNDSIGQTIADGQFFDVHFKPYIDDLERGDVMVDVGANIGFFSVYTALRDVFVNAFEASSEVFQVLKKNIVENNVEEKVRAVNVALYDKPMHLGINPKWTDWIAKEGGEIDYSKMGNSGGLSLVPDENGKWFSRTLDSFLFEKVDLIKVGTQGSDLRVLRGAKTTIGLFRPVICFEFEHDGSGVNASGDSLNDFQAFFFDWGYDMMCVGGNGMNWLDYVAIPKENV